MRVGTFSLGLCQRLGIASALLGDPDTLILDEPVNGLDPDGIRWVRDLMRALAAEGRTVFVSSHLMSEMAVTADHLIVIGRGKLLADESVEHFIHRHSGNVVRVRTLRADALAAAVAGPDVTVGALEAGLLEVEGLTAAQIGELAARNGWVLHELTPQQVTLEDAFMDLTQDEVEYRAQAPKPEEVGA